MRMYCLYCCIKIPGGSWAKSSTVSENLMALTADTETGALGSGILQVYCNISSIAYKTQLDFPRCLGHGLFTQTCMITSDYLRSLHVFIPSFPLPCVSPEPLPGPWSGSSVPSDEMPSFHQHSARQSGHSARKNHLTMFFFCRFVSEVL